jgi:hypothetical protein
MDSVSPKKKKSRIAKKKKKSLSNEAVSSLSNRQKREYLTWFPVWQKSPTKWRVAARTNQLRAFDIFQTNRVNQTLWRQKRSLRLALYPNRRCAPTPRPETAATRHSLVPDARVAETTSARRAYRRLFSVSRAKKFFRLDP